MNYQKRFPEYGWWRGLSMAEVKIELSRFRGMVFEPEEVEFTHNVLLKSIRAVPASESELVAAPFSGTPLLYLSAPDYPLVDEQILEGPFRIGEAGQVEDHSPAFRFAFVRIGLGRPIYGEVHPQLEMRPKR